MRFYKKNLIPLLITFEIWTILYNIFISVLKNKAFDFNELWQNMLFIKQVGIPNMWYMPMIIGIYLALPYVAIIVKKIDFKVLKIPMIIVFLFLVILPNINDLTKALFNEQYKTILDLSFLGGVYGLYILLGYYIGNNGLKKINGAYLVIIGIISFILTCLYQFWRYEIGKGYNVWYDFVGLFIISVCLFELLSRIKNNLSKKFENIFIYISKASLGLFFVHAIIQNILTRFIPFKNINNSIAALVLAVMVFVLSITIIAILSKIKFIKNKVFLIK